MGEPGNCHVVSGTFPAKSGCTAGESAGTRLTPAGTAHDETKVSDMSRMRKATAVAMLVGGMMLGGAGVASADANAYGEANNSPGVLSGNVVQIPISIPINVCGNSIGVVSALNPAFGNTCSNGDVQGNGPAHEGWHHMGWYHEGWHHAGWFHHEGDHYGRGDDCC